MGFTEPGRSPGLLVSSYLTVSPLPRPRRKHRGRGGFFSVALSLSGGRVKQPRTVGVTHHRALRSPDFPPRQVLRCELSGRFPAPLAQTEAPRRSSRPPRTSLYTLRRGLARRNPNGCFCVESPERLNPNAGYRARTSHRQFSMCRNFINIVPPRPRSCTNESGRPRTGPSGRRRTRKQTIRTSPSNL
jgi:hypothetical protein